MVFINPAANYCEWGIYFLLCWPRFVQLFAGNSSHWSTVTILLPYFLITCT